MTTTALSPQQNRNLRQVDIFTYWLPLAFSWLLMLGLTPLLQGVVSRLPDPEISIAAYGLVFSIGTVLEAPVVPLLSTSTALSRNRQYFRMLGKFTLILSAFTVGCQALFSLTPLYTSMLVPLIHVPPELVEPLRLGMTMMIPWSFFVGWRRYLQGVLIRHGRTKVIGTGTFLRIASVLLSAILLSVFSHLPGAAIAALTHTLGTLVEAIFISIVVQPTLKQHYAAGTPTPDEPPLKMWELTKFHLPLYASTMLFFLNRPLVSAALARTPNPTLVLAAWPLLTGLLTLVRSPSVAYPEATIGLLERPGALPALKRFSVYLALGSLALFVLVAFTPLRWVYFDFMLGISPELTALTLTGTFWALLIPLSGPYDAFLRGVLTARRKTYALTLATLGSLLAMTAVLVVGVMLEMPGIPLGAAATAASYLADLLVIWLAYRWLEKHKPALIAG